MDVQCQQHPSDRKRYEHDADCRGNAGCSHLKIPRHER
jgi:hypothetical protein